MENWKSIAPLNVVLYDNPEMGTEDARNGPKQLSRLRTAD